VFIKAKDDGGVSDNWTTGAISRAKLQSNHHHQQTNIQFFFTGNVVLCHLSALTLLGDRNGTLLQPSPQVLWPSLKYWKMCLFHK